MENIHDAVHREILTLPFLSSSTVWPAQWQPPRLSFLLPAIWNFKFGITLTTDDETPASLLPLYRISSQPASRRWQLSAFFFEVLPTLPTLSSGFEIRHGCCAGPLVLSRISNQASAHRILSCGDRNWRIEEELEELLVFFLSRLFTLSAGCTDPLSQSERKILALKRNAGKGMLTCEMERKRRGWELERSPKDVESKRKEMSRSCGPQRPRGGRGFKPEHFSILIRCVGRFTWAPKSPKFPTFELKDPIHIQLIINEVGLSLFYVKLFAGFVFTFFISITVLCGTKISYPIVISLWNWYPIVIIRLKNMLIPYPMGVKVKWIGTLAFQRPTTR